jgi:hypothetical protein
MDLIQHCLGLIPAPYLAEVFSIFRLAWTSVAQMHCCQKQLHVLGTCVAQLLTTVNTEIAENRLAEGSITEALENLCQ